MTIDYTQMTVTVVDGIILEDNIVGSKIYRVATKSIVGVETCNACSAFDLSLAYQLDGFEWTDNIYFTCAIDVNVV